jgi:hypothetical protein
MDGCGDIGCFVGASRNVCWSCAVFRCLLGWRSIFLPVERAASCFARDWHFIVE